MSVPSVIKYTFNFQINRSSLNIKKLHVWIKDQIGYLFQIKLLLTLSSEKLKNAQNKNKQGEEPVERKPIYEINIKVTETFIGLCFYIKAAYLLLEIVRVFDD